MSGFGQKKELWSPVYNIQDLCQQIVVYIILSCKVFYIFSVLILLLCLEYEAKHALCDTMYVLNIIIVKIFFTE